MCRQCKNGPMGIDDPPIAFFMELVNLHYNGKDVDIIGISGRIVSNFIVINFVIWFIKIHEPPLTQGMKSFPCNLF